MNELDLIMHAPAFLVGYGLGVVIGATCLYMAITSNYKLNYRDRLINTKESK